MIFCYHMYIRIIIILLLTFVCIALSYYSAHHHPWITLTQCLENPELYNGQIVTGFHEPLIGKIYEDGFMLHHSDGDSIRVYADTTGLSKNEYISIKARFYKEGYLKAINIHVAKNRRTKIVLSTIPIFFLVFIFFKNYRFNIKNFQIELKNHA